MDTLVLLIFVVLIVVIGMYFYSKPNSSETVERIPESAQDREPENMNNEDNVVQEQNE